jgi:hypothetical protein
MLIADRCMLKPRKSLLRVNTLLKKSGKKTRITKQENKNGDIGRGIHLARIVLVSGLFSC